jgi:hypothetical protein
LEKNKGKEMKKTKDQQISHLQGLLNDAKDARDYKGKYALGFMITSALLFVILLTQFKTVDRLVQETRHYRLVNKYYRLVNKETLERQLHKDNVSLSHRLCDRFTKISGVPHVKYFNDIGCVAKHVRLDSIDKLKSAIDHFKLGAK